MCLRRLRAHDHPGDATDGPVSAPRHHDVDAVLERGPGPLFRVGALHHLHLGVDAGRPEGFFDGLLRDFP